jgi:hypothetical protein
MGGLESRARVDGPQVNTLFSMETNRSRRIRLPSPKWINMDPIISPKELTYGNWFGAANVYFREDRKEYVAVLRDRKPLDKGRGSAVVVMTSKDGNHFNTENPNFTFTRSDLDTEKIGGADSFERAAMDFLPDGRTALYISRAVPGTKHWNMLRPVAKNKNNPYDFDKSDMTILPLGDPEAKAVKDPVTYRDGDNLHMWYTAHNLNDGQTQKEKDDNADQMWTEHIESFDEGKTWTTPDVVLEPRVGKWDSRGARLTAVLWDEVNHEPISAYYDGRSSKSQNYYELPGIAIWNSEERRFESISDEPEAWSPNGTWHPDGTKNFANTKGAFRYPSIVIRNGKLELYYEGTLEQGAHGTFRQKFDLAA